MGEIVSLPNPMDREERAVLRRQLVDQVTHLSDTDLVEVLKWLEAIAQEEQERLRARGPAAIVPFRQHRGIHHHPDLR
jgi:hypothetical protein